MAHIYRGFQSLYTVSAPDNDVNKMPANTKVDDYSEWVYDEAFTNVRLTVEFNNCVKFADFRSTPVLFAVPPTSISRPSSQVRE